MKKSVRRQGSGRYWNAPGATGQRGTALLLNTRESNMRLYR